jgi:integrase/recombinase XerD
MSQSSLSSFQRHLQARGLRPTTQKVYLSYISRLIAHAGAPAEDSVTADQAYAFLVDLANHGLRSASGYNVAFHTVVRWFEMRGVALDLHGLQPQRQYQLLPRWLTEEVVQRLMVHIPDRRYRLAFQVVLATGLRVSELIALRVTDIERHAPLLRVTNGKGGKSRYVLLPETLRIRLRDYWTTWRPTGIFFERKPGRDASPMLPVTLNEVLARAQIAAGLPDRITIHQFRHTYAISMLRNNINIVTLQHLMGHRSITTTVRYLTPDLQRQTDKPIDLLKLFSVEP